MGETGEGGLSGLSGLSRSSNQINQTNKTNQINETTRHGIVPVGAYQAVAAHARGALAVEVRPDKPDPPGTA